MATTTVLLAAATGHVMQNGDDLRRSYIMLTGSPEAITPLAASLNDVPSGIASSPRPMPSPRDGRMILTHGVRAAEPPQARVRLAALNEPPAAVPLAAPTAVPVMVDAPVPATPVVETAPALPQAESAVSLDSAAVTDCSVRLDLAGQPDAMIGVALSAPCRRDERVVLRHGGLAVTGRTTSSGSLYVSLPAMEAMAEVSVLFAGGETVVAKLELPAAASVRRFAVQWQGDDAFQLHAFEGGADYGTPGHVSAADPHLPVADSERSGGFLSLLGDDQVENPLLAEVYTYPGDGTDVRVVVEAAVTDRTCGREILGEALDSALGTVAASDLSVAMPDCDAVGDYLVLQDLAPDLKIAAAN